MHKKVIEFNQKQRTTKFPNISPGDIVKVHRRIFEKDKEMVQIFEGVILAIKGRQSSSPTITVRKVSHGVGVELVLPMYSPIVKKIEIVKKAKAKRSKLYYIRDKSAKSLKMKYQEVSDLIGKEEEKKEIVEKSEVKDGDVEEESKEDKKVVSKESASSDNKNEDKKDEKSSEKKEEDKK